MAMIITDDVMAMIMAMTDDVMAMIITECKIWNFKRKTSKS